MHLGDCLAYLATLPLHFCSIFYFSFTTLSTRIYSRAANNEFGKFERKMRNVRRRFRKVDELSIDFLFATI